MSGLDPKSRSKIEAGIEEFEFRKTAIMSEFWYVLKPLPAVIIWQGH